ncbi:hypothetical protein BS78_05G289000 [Paspalum vaginatum]|nr:hypothetical protein BS78_05G289000 [Paspalum vaginatum]
MADAPEDPEPSSPSIFRDPSPPSGDLVLPFISRMLMEEDEDISDDSFFRQYPDDHPALLTVQHPFAEILSDVGNTACGEPMTGQLVGPVELELSLPLQQNLPRLPNEENTRGAAAALPPADGCGRQHGALLSALFGGGHPDHPGGEGDDEAGMIKIAFLRGMEEASRFLPTTTNNGPLIGTSTSSGCGEKTNKKRGTNKRRNDEDDSMVAGASSRNTKLMVLQVSMPELQTDGEMVAQVIINEFNVCIGKIKRLHWHITINGGEAESTSTKKKNTRRPAQHDDADLHTLLIHCARAVGTNDRSRAAELLRRIKQQSSPRGDPSQRLAHCFAAGLAARLAGTGTQAYNSTSSLASSSSSTSAVEYLKAYQLYLESCCFRMTSFSFSNWTIIKTIAATGRKKVHIVDYGIDYGMQWPTFLTCLAGMEGGPPEVRITGIDLPQPGLRPSSRLDETGRRLSSCAGHLGVPFKFQSVVSARWETIRGDDLGIDPDELLVVNSLGSFGSLIDDEAVDGDSPSPSPRDAVLNNIRGSIRPDLFILCIVNASYSSPFFVTRFREALSYYTALFDMLDATLPRDSQQRLLVERDLYGRCAMNAVACEGPGRVERPEAYRQWQARNHRAGLRQLPLDQETVQYVREKIWTLFHKDFVIDTDQQWLLKGWKGRILYAISTWVADDDSATCT